MIKNVLFLIAIIYCTATSLSAQNPIPAFGEVFIDNVIPRIDVFIAPDSLDMLLDPANIQSDYHYYTTVMFDNGTVRDTFEDAGFRLRGNTSRFAAKKSLKISLNTYAPGRKYHGLEKLNINGEHNDPSIMRSKLCWDMLRAIGVPAPRCNHAELYVNEMYVGLFANVEHIDEQFVQSRFGNNNGNLYKCLYPVTLEYLGTNPNLYKQDFDGRRIYDLKNNQDTDDYADLAQFIYILNHTNTNSMPCELEKVFNVDAYLKVIAFDILTSNWDGPIYNKNNFYLYHNQATGQFEYIPFDVDNTFGIDWFIGGLANRNIYDWSHPNEARPIYDKIMAVPLYRNRFSYYMKQIIDTYFNANHLNPYLDAKKALIDESVMNDPLHSADYGYSFEDYETSFDDDLGAHVTYGLKPYIAQRSASALAQLNLQNIEPIVKNMHSNRPTFNQDISITAKVEDDGAVANVQICYQTNENELLTCVNMLDDGLHQDGTAHDGVYGIQLAGYSENTNFHYYIEATDNTNLTMRQPFCNFKTLPIDRNGLELYINELMASNEGTIADEAGEFDDWIEIYNGSNEAIFLGDKYLTDDITRPNKWKFPDLSIAAGEYLIVWADEDQEQGELHCNFKLSAGGEYVGLFMATADEGTELIDEVTFGEQTTDIAWGRLPNGTGPFQTVAATPGMSNMPVAVKKIEETLAKILVYPNPFSEELNIVLTEKIGEDLEVQVSNHLGQVVYTNTLKNSEASSLIWKRGHLAEGIYTIGFYKNGIFMGGKQVVLVR